MTKIKVAIIGMGKEGSSVFRVLRTMNFVEIKGVLDFDLTLPGVILARKDKVFATESLAELITMPDLDVIILTATHPDIKAEVEELKNKDTTLLDAVPGSLFMSILQAKEELLQLQKLKGELGAILNSAHEAIEMADNTGLIKYVNPAFTRVTGIPEAGRVGKNIFEVSPHGALTKSLITQKTVIGYRSKVGGSGVEVISNASPIVVEGEIVGSVVVFQAITDILKLMDELQKSTTIIENLYAKIDQITGSKFTFDDLIGHSKIFVSTLEMAKKASKSESSVLLTGESGTGKELYAHAIHHASQRRSRPFIKVSCASIPEELLESELFGHEKGAFTGAVKTKLGKVELANGGTLFLDEINEINHFMQGKLLRLLQDLEFERVGGGQAIKADIRIIAATNVNLITLVRKGVFREELFFRLNVIELNLPALRQRREDIAELVEYFLSKMSRKHGKKIRNVTADAQQLLINYEWPGNIRELENILERALVTIDNEVITKQNLSPYIGQFENQQVAHYTDIMPLDKMEQIMIKAALSRYGETLEGKKKAAQALNISLATLYNKLKKYTNNL